MRAAGEVRTRGMWTSERACGEVSRDGARVGREDVGVAAKLSRESVAYPRRPMRPPVYRLFARSSRDTTTADLGLRRLGEPLVRPLPSVCLFPVTAHQRDLPTPPVLQLYTWVSYVTSKKKKLPGETAAHRARNDALMRCNWKETHTR